MPHRTYLIIGGGMSADSAVRGIREVDSTSTIVMISAEPELPYDRPPLTKGLWKDKPLDSIWRHTEKQRVEFYGGRTVETVDIQQKRLKDDHGNTYTFDKLLLATGGRPRRLPLGDEQIIYYRTLGDYRRLKALAEKNKRFAVIGNGFIGAEIAAGLAMNQKEVVMLFRGGGICEHVFPRDLSEFMNDYYRQHGIEILARESIAGLQRRGDQFVVQTSSGRETTVAGVVAGIGIQPNVELAQAAGLNVENGILVNEVLQTSHPDIYAAGDVARFYCVPLEKQVRVEHEDNANTMGRLAGRNMAGKSEPYRHLPFFYSYLFDLGYEAVGELDSGHEIFADWKKAYQEGVIYYLRNGRVRGVLLWNVWGKVDAARTLIAEPGPFRPNELKGKLTG